MTRIDFLKEMIKKAGQAVMAIKPDVGLIEKEGRANFVTAADLASEKILMNSIQNNFPGEDILSEETESTITDPLQCEHLWVMDPLDGTNNFRYERQYFMISVGYLEKGEMIAGATYDPLHMDLYWAEKGKGAFCNGGKLQVSPQSELSKAIIATDNSYNPEGTKYNLELMLRLPTTPWIMMRGSAVHIMCDVASGKVDAYMHTALKPWDNAAGFLIAQEAGAEVVGLDGKPISFLSDSVVMGNKTLVDTCLASFR